VDRGGLPETVCLPDGRSEPFEPERITRSLFAAAERVGDADAFLAQELTEGVLHFLTAESGGPTTSPGQIADVVARVVRELGRPAIARAYEQRGAVTRDARKPADTIPEWFNPSLAATGIAFQAATATLTDFSLAHVYPRDLVFAHREGLIRLTGLAAPLELAAMSAAIPPDGVLEAVLAARDVAGGLLAVDGPEYDLAAAGGDFRGPVGAYIRDLSNAAAAVGLSVILNLNSTPPPRFSEAAGPLFQPGPPPEPTARKAIALDLARAAGEAGIAVWWHVNSDLPAGDDERLETVVRAALAGAPVEFVFDRPRTPVVLGPGIDRGTPAALTEVGVNLVRLVEQMGGPPVDPEILLRKVGSLTRFAKTAAHVKQDFLRRHGRPAVREAFLVDRARLVIVPIGLESAARATERAPAEFARELVKAIRTAAETDRPRILPVRVDSPFGDWGGISFPMSGTSTRQQVRAVSPLHAAAGAGRLDLFADQASDVAGALEGIRIAGESAVVRHRFRVEPTEPTGLDAASK
jgi:ATP cone domain